MPRPSRRDAPPAAPGSAPAPPVRATRARARSATAAGHDASTSPGFLLWLATLRWQREVALTLRPLGLTHVQFVLLGSVWWLASQGEHPSQRRLADHAGTDPMMTSQVVRALERQGLVARTPDGRDARVVRVAVTAEGGRLAVAAVRAMDALDQRLFADLPPELTDALRRLAGRDQDRAGAEPS